jgi:alginate O-acetyltransferase complex protein AlgI
MVLRWTVYAGVFCAIVLFGAYGSGYGVVDPLYANF